MTTLLDTLIHAARLGGAVVMRHYEAGVEAHEKSDGSPVTLADTQAEAAILAQLALDHPGVPTVGEETGASPGAGSGTFFLIDPLDGTREFIGRNGEFTVNIALIEHGEPVAGVVLAPAMGRLFAGARGAGAFEIMADGSRRPLRVRASPPAPVVLGSRSHATPETRLWLERFPGHGAEPCGSSVKFGRLAAGEADLYPRLGPTMEWDTAAGDAVLRAAGGLTVTLEGEPLRYGRAGGDWRNPHFIAYGDPALAARCRSAA
ncbi:3'(2'),5'-bisphosphate nucleotidase CysQ [Aureimonas sp. AU4]|uniref:3'(2'),5'-bisphosphate nucleotidase CysQ n=1 Tax=Aureimonas sp. AU4 TaxID=1638163 RepID=UPI00078549BA|nr:3'(2'),5'-bisphosphate nucleotidase CysQ [Aureimonas sp. AU4]